MRSYSDLSPKGKFIRTCIAVPVCWGILIALWVWLQAHFRLGTRLIIELVIASVLAVPLGIRQLVSTYRAYINDRDGY